MIIYNYLKEARFLTSFIKVKKAQFSISEI